MARTNVEPSPIQLDPTPPLLSHFTHTPKTLLPLVPWLNALPIIALLVGGAAVALCIAAPEFHKLSASIGAGAAAAGGGALLLRVSLWTIPWLAAGAIAATATTVIVLAIELHRRRVGPIIPANPDTSTTAENPDFPLQAAKAA